MDVLLRPFETVAFDTFGAPTTWGELLGFVTGAWCVWLLVRRSPWNWPIGMVNTALFLLLFLDAGLFADSALQVVYLVLGAYGWWAWVRRGADGDRLRVTRTTRRQWVGLAVAGVVATAVIAAVLAAWTSSTVPVPDAVTTVLSLLATWGQARKKVESWWLWIAADLIYVPLYQYKGLTLTALLYLGFLGLCLLGLLEWRRDVAHDARPRSVQPVPA
ncbi:MAG: nicotinamide riboside transporter PnuC [Kineosporiaceae bacterium]